MDIKIAHARNPATAWDIEVTIQGEKDEKVSSVKVVINDFPEPTENVAPPKKFWRKLYTQKGNFPGDNKVEVTATDQSGQPTGAEDQWS